MTAKQSVHEVVRLCRASTIAMALSALMLVVMPSTAPAQAQVASSPEQAARVVKQRTGGRILGVRADGDRYLVKVMKGTKVKVVAVPRL